MGTAFPDLRGEGENETMTFTDHPSDKHTLHLFYSLFSTPR